MISEKERILDKKIHLETLKIEGERKKEEKERMTRRFKGSPVKFIPKGWSRRATIKLKKI